MNGAGFVSRWSHPAFDDHWRTDPWSIDVPLADDGTPPG